MVKEQQGGKEEKLMKGPQSVVAVLNAFAGASQGGGPYPAGPLAVSARAPGHWGCCGHRPSWVGPADIVLKGLHACVGGLGYTGACEGGLHGVGL